MIYVSREEYSAYSHIMLPSVGRVAPLILSVILVVSPPLRTLKLLKSWSSQSALSPPPFMSIPSHVLTLWSRRTNTLQSSSFQSSFIQSSPSWYWHSKSSPSQSVLIQLSTIQSSSPYSGSIQFSITQSSSSYSVPIKCSAIQSSPSQSVPIQPLPSLRQALSLPIFTLPVLTPHPGSFSLFI